MVLRKPSWKLDGPATLLPDPGPAHIGCAALPSNVHPRNRLAPNPHPATELLGDLGTQAPGIPSGTHVPDDRVCFVLRARRPAFGGVSWVRYQAQREQYGKSYWYYLKV